MSAGPAVGPSTQGALRWAIRRSFRDYVASLPDGEERVGNGAQVDSDGGFLFPTVYSEAVTPIETTLSFRGSITFRGHGGVLAVEVDGLQIHLVEGGRSTVTVSRGEGLEDGRHAIAAFSDWQYSESHIVVPAPRLTWSGSALLGGVYDVGEMLDPIEIDRVSSSS